MVATVDCVDKVTLLGSQTEPLMRSHDIICYHTMVGYLFSTDNYFRKTNGAGFSGTESHFGVGGKWGSDAIRGLDGKIWQWQDLRYQADANLDGGHRVISIETADNAPKYAKDIEPWTPKQLEANIRLGVDLCRKYNIPAVLIPDTKPGRRGIGYHQQGVDPYRVSGGEKWSNSYGKECPTKRRIDQLKNIVIPEIARRLRGTAPGEDWLDMATKEDVKDAFREVLNERVHTSRWDGVKRSVMDFLNATNLYSIEGGWAGNRPAGYANAGLRGTPTTARQITLVIGDTNADLERHMADDPADPNA